MGHWNVRFAPNSGRKWATERMSAFDPKRTLPSSWPAPRLSRTQPGWVTAATDPESSMRATMTQGIGALIKFARLTWQLFLIIGRRLSSPPAPVIEIDQSDDWGKSSSTPKVALLALGAHAFARPGALERIPANQTPTQLCLIHLIGQRLLIVFFRLTQRHDSLMLRCSIPNFRSQSTKND